jgi:nucleoid DNA-binding protein
MTTRKSLVAFVANKLDMSKKDADVVVGTVVEGMMDVVKKEGKLQLTGVITLKTRVAPTRTGINPKTQEKIQIPERTVLSAKFGTEFKAAVNKAKKSAAKKPAKKEAPAAKGKKPAGKKKK